MRANRILRDSQWLNLITDGQINYPNSYITNFLSSPTLQTAFHYHFRQDSLYLSALPFRRPPPWLRLLLAMLYLTDLSPSSTRTISSRLSPFTPSPPVRRSSSSVSLVLSPPPAGKLLPTLPFPCNRSGRLIRFSDLVSEIRGFRSI